MASRDAGSGAQGRVPGRARHVDVARSSVLVASTALSIGLWVWGSVGWYRAYRAQSEIDHRVSAEERRDAELLLIVVRGGEAAAQLALEGTPFDALSAEAVVGAE